jgi:hypothetical protein
LKKPFNVSSSICEGENYMSKPKVLIMVHGGVAEYLCMGDVDVVLVDEDNIDAGDPRVELDPEWGPHMRGVYDLPNSKYVCITQSDAARPTD